MTATADLDTVSRQAGWSAALSQIGSRLTRLREARGWTRARLATEAGISSGYISLVENGFRLPSLETAVLLPELLGAPAHALLVDPGPDQPSLLRFFARHGPRGSRP